MGIYVREVDVETNGVKACVIKKSCCGRGFVERKKVNK